MQHVPGFDGAPRTHCHHLLTHNIDNNNNTIQHG